MTTTLIVSSTHTSDTHKRKICGGDRDDDKSYESKQARASKVTFADAHIVYEYKKARKLPRDTITPLGMDKEVDRPMIKQARCRTLGFADVYFSDRLSFEVVEVKVSGSFLACKQAKLKHSRAYYVIAVVGGNSVYCTSGMSDEYGIFDFQTAFNAKADDDVELRIFRGHTVRSQIIAKICRRF